MMNTTVLITAIGSFAAESVIAGCKRDGFRAIGCDIYPGCWVVNSLEVDAFYQAPYATEEEAYRQFVRELVKKEKIAYIFPLTDVEIDLFYNWEEAEKELGVRICMSGRDTIYLCRNKDRMEAFLKEKKLCQTIEGKELGQIGEKKFPLVIKPVNGRSSQGLSIVKSQEEWDVAMAIVNRQTDGGYSDYLVQPYITGNVVTVDVVRNEDTRQCVCLPRKELLRTLNGCGTTVYVFHHEALEEQCRQMADALNIRGCVNFEFIESQEDQDVVYYFLECNPRFSGGVAFSLLAGYDMVKNHIHCFTGRELEPMKTVKNQYLARRYREYQMGEGES